MSGRVLGAHVTARTMSCVTGPLPHSEAEVVTPFHGGAEAQVIGQGAACCAGAQGQGHRELLLTPDPSFPAVLPAQWVAAVS